MIHAYDRTYLASAQTLLARACDYAVYDAGSDACAFFCRFATSPFAARFESGDPGVLVGMSGVELARSVLELAGKSSAAEVCYAVGRSPEYWAGWALAYYQWRTALPFAEIEGAASFEQVVEMYDPYHEMDVRQFADALDERYRVAFPDARAKRRRLIAGLTQAELADLSGVPLRTVQQYEQRQKDISKAAADTVIRLAQVLACRPVDLLDLVPAA